jgi:hypothetical protein
MLKTFTGDAQLVSNRSRTFQPGYANHYIEGIVTGEYPVLNCVGLCCNLLSNGLCSSYWY